MKNLFSFSCFIILLNFQMKAVSVETEPKFSIQVSNTSVLFGNYFEVTFTLKNGKANKFEAPNFKDFDIVGGPNQSSTFSMMNGQTTQSISYTYYLKPKNIGNFYLEPAFIEADGKTLETEPIEIMVLDNPDGIIEKPKQKSSPQMELFNFPTDDFFQTFPDSNFFNLPKMEIPKQEGNEGNDGKKKKSKKKRKVYKI